MNEQEEIRKECKFLKWAKDISYIQMAEEIGISKNTFYNFISGRRANLGYKSKVKLIDYIERTKREWIEKK